MSTSIELAAPTHSSACPLADRRETIAALYEAHFASIARYIAVRIGDWDDAVDMSSEVFLRALAALDSYTDQGCQMKTWLFKIAHNLAVDYLRKRHRHPCVPLEAANTRAADRDLVEDAELREAVESVRGALSHLTSGQQSVLTLRFGGELTSLEVAQVMGKRPGAVREMQHAAIQKLRELVELS